MKNSKGFTLVELMFVVAIVGVLAAYAFNSYQNSVRKSNRAEAKADIMDVAHRLQRCYTAYGRYDSDDCAIYTQLSAEGGKIMTQGRGFYEITGVFTSTTYELKATAVLIPQTADTGCTAMTINHLSTRGPADCW